MDMKNMLVIVPGGLNTDIIGYGVDHLLGSGELTLGGELKIGPGGKSRNMAQMAAVYLGAGKVAMMGRTSRDPFGLWKPPIEALHKTGVDTSRVKIGDFADNGGKFPGIALIPVDKNGKNQIYVLPGVNADFCAADLDEAEALFLNPSMDKIMLLALEIPVDTARHALEKAAIHNIRVVMDPGGISQPIDELLSDRIFLLKPNEHEARIMTGIRVSDFESAGKAAAVLLEKGVQNVLITHGVHGAYLFNSHEKKHFSIPAVADSGVHDETGCGDQVTAIIAACLAEGHTLESSVRMAIAAGTLQFYRAGIQPVEREALSALAGK